MPATEQIRKKLSVLPHKPGVYLMKDRFGTVIYVGKARDLRKRVSQYFHPSRRLGWDLKFNALVEAIHDLDVHVVKNEAEALLLEGRLIKEFQPRYNISFRDDKRFLLVKVNLHDPIPRFTLTRLRTDDGSRYFGPFPNAGALRSTLALMRRTFNLRGCRALTPTEADYKHCLYANLKWCTAPCIGNVTREQYLEQVQAACDFLGGQCDELREQLEIEMRKAAAAQAYEKAAQLRDALADLRRTAKKTTRFERTPWNLPVAVMPERDNLELGKVLVLPGPPERIEGFDISNISGTLKVASVVRFKNGRPDRSNYRRMKIKTVVGQDDFACMAEAVRRRYTRLLKEEESARAEQGKEPSTEDQHGSGIAAAPRRTGPPLRTAQPHRTGSASCFRRSAQSRQPAGFDRHRWRQRAARRGLRRTGQAGVGLHSRDWISQGIRGSVSARPARAAAAPPRQQCPETSATYPRRIPSGGEFLQRPIALAENLGEHPRRMSGHRRGPQGRALEEVRFRATAARGDNRADCRSARFRRESGGRAQGVFGRSDSAVTIQSKGSAPASGPVVGASPTTFEHSEMLTIQ